MVNNYDIGGLIVKSITVHGELVEPLNPHRVKPSTNSG